MNDKTIPPKKADPAKKGGTNRKDRLAEQLRANLRSARRRRVRGAPATLTSGPKGWLAAEEMHKD